MHQQVVMLPLYIRGVADLDTNSIIISYKQSLSSMLDTLLHEFAHLIVRDKNHSVKWERTYKSLGGRRVNHRDAFDQQFVNIGYMPNIGNISGIQNIY